MDKLLGIGYWYSDPLLEIPWNANFPDPRDLVDKSWFLKYGNMVARYLDSGLTLIQWRGISYCRFDCGVEGLPMGSQCLTDGLWVWPEGLSHYVLNHAVYLPDVFLHHIQSLNGKVPRDVELQGLSKDNIDYDYWIEWGKKEVLAN